MRSYMPVATTVAVALSLSSGGLAQQVKNVPYPEVKVNVGEPFQQDASFRKMRDSFVEATNRKDVEKLMRLVGPTFMSTIGLMPAESFDMGQGAAQNFKVTFGFRKFGSNADGGVDGGPLWNLLAEFASESIFYEVVGIRNLVCGPLAAEIADDETFERARKTIENDDAGARWYFTINSVAATNGPVASSPVVANIGTVALPLLRSHPPGAAAATHLQVLLPTGRMGWIPVASARPLISDRLCYAKTPDGDWKIAAYEKSG